MELESLVYLLKDLQLGQAVLKLGLHVDGKLDDVGSREALDRGTVVHEFDRQRGVVEQDSVNELGQLYHTRDCLSRHLGCLELPNHFFFDLIVAPLVVWL